MAVTRQRTVQVEVRRVAPVVAVNRVALTQGARALAVKVAQAAQAQAQAARAAEVSQAGAVFHPAVQAKPPLSPVQALPMRRAAAQIVVARVQEVQAMVVAAARVVYLEAMVVQVLL
jgi:hypothetical protein